MKEIKPSLGIIFTFKTLTFNASKIAFLAQRPNVNTVVHGYSGTFGSRRKIPLKPSSRYRNASEGGGESYGLTAKNVNGLTNYFPCLSIK